jgi:hypothetical protein
MKKIILSILAIILVVSAVMTTIPAKAAEDEGCSLGYWKNNSDCWGCFMNELVGWLFLVPPELHELADDTLMDALKYKGGRGVEGAARNLLRQATASILNACHSDISYPMSVGEVITAVDGALNTLDRVQILDLKTMLREYNKLGCPIDSNCMMK